jgi:hypothetical protein
VDSLIVLSKRVQITPFVPSRGSAKPGLLHSFRDWSRKRFPRANVIERSVILCETETFSLDESWLPRDRGKPFSPGLSLAQAIETHERVEIETALAETCGKVSGPSGAAVKLGLKPSTLASKIKALNINKHAFKGRGENPFANALAEAHL